jgi:hypothetical protein
MKVEETKNNKKTTGKNVPKEEQFIKRIREKWFYA